MVFSRLLADAGVAALCVLVFWLPRGTPPSAVAVLVVAGVLLRSRWPVVAFGVVAAATLAGALLGVTWDPFVAAAWTLYPVAIAHGGPCTSRAVTVVLGATVAVMLTAGAGGQQEITRYVIVSVLVLAGTWRLGEAVRRERQEAAQAERAESARAVLAERLRVAREVHDVVSHSLGTIAVTAGVAAHVDTGDAERLRDRLTRIERTSKDALADLRAVLGTVRDAASPAERRPQPGVKDLPALAQRMRAAGIDVTLTVRGTDGLPPSAGLAVYRIVQEGLTNAVRHAPGCRCRVTVEVLDGRVVAEVVDDGGTLAGTRHHEKGFGLIGLRERVESLGGELTSGAREQGGFALRAVLPLPGA
ncbi:Signal transduction histidine kinase [Lentzea fradiae]|uniref:histidine kinase n=1 Tax=Lentzea fradiae TaxID=200378 RepID=A0A1G7W128_9PSEU|nr:sensor histidine kinase [Lentzea fradiae]SDG65725.1 Signal transduction histidine kinase [Lentzea fradiae]